MYCELLFCRVEIVSSTVNVTSFMTKTKSSTVNKGNNKITELRTVNVTSFMTKTKLTVTLYMTQSLWVI